MSTEQPAAADAATALEAVATAAEGIEPAVLEAAAPTDPAVPEAAATEQPKDDKFAAKFAALSKREKQLRQQETAMKQRLREMEAQFKATEERLKPFMSLQESASKDPNILWENLKAAGLTEQQLIEKAILKQEPTAEEKQLNMMQQLQKEIEALKSEKEREKEETKQKEVEFQKRSQEQAKATYLKHLGDFVAKNAEQYELIRTNDAVDLVYEVMEEHYNLTEQENGKGELLTEKEASDKVEEFLFEQAKKIIESNKLRQLVSAPKATEPPKKGQSATLSNSIAQKVPSKSEPFLSDAESKRQMAAMIKFTS